MISECGIRIAECGMHDPRELCSAAVGARAGIRAPQSRIPQSAIRSPQSRRAFTLVELLVVITILGILTALVLGVAAVAAGTARQARSEAMVARLHTLVVDYWDSFRNRRVELNDTVELQINSLAANNIPTGPALAEARLYGLRETLILEVPDRWSDLLGMSLGDAADAPPPAANARAPGYLAARPALTQMFLRRYEQVRSATNKLKNAPNTVGDLRQNQGAECLYMIVTMATADGEARGMFKES